MNRRGFFAAVAAVAIEWRLQAPMPERAEEVWLSETAIEDLLIEIHRAGNMIAHDYIAARVLVQGDEVALRAISHPEWYKS